MCIVHDFLWWLHLKTFKLMNTFVGIIWYVMRPLEIGSQYDWCLFALSAPDVACISKSHWFVRAIVCQQHTYTLVPHCTSYIAHELITKAYDPMTWSSEVMATSSVYITDIVQSVSSLYHLQIVATDFVSFKCCLKKTPWSQSL